MRYDIFKMLVFNEFVSSLGLESVFEDFYKRINFDNTDSEIKDLVKDIVNGGKKNEKSLGEFDNLKDRIDKKSPYKTQVGGSHYQSNMQPAQFIRANNLNFNQGNVVKYIGRYKSKNGLQDLEKVVQYTLFEVFEEYPDEYENFILRVKQLIGE